MLKRLISKLKDTICQSKFQRGVRPERYPMCKDQPAQIDCWAIKCKKHGKGACHDISPALTLNTDGSFVCWSMEAITFKLNG